MNLSNRSEERLVFARMEAEARGLGLEVCDRDFSRPWGGFLRFTEESLPKFLSAYYDGVDTGKQGGRRDPKVLLVGPGRRLSLQLHHRRAELWRVLDGPVLIVHGNEVEQLKHDVLFAGDVIHLACGEIHRLCGPLTGWGRVAEIWEHTDPSNPSDESDIERLQDDYQR